jgi:general secretion pathway protein A
VPLDTHAVVVIDEAQSIQPAVLDQIRMLTAFEQDGQRLVQVVLVGQPMLLNTLKTEPLYAMNERITRRVTLVPLEPSEVDAYISHRLEIAGGAEAVRFEPSASRVIADLSRGLPRRVNLLCDRALQQGRIVGASAIGSDMVKRAARSLSGAPPEALPEPPAAAAMLGEPAAAADAPSPEAATVAKREWPRWWPIAASAAGGFLILGSGLYGWMAHSVVTADPAIPAPPEFQLDRGAPAPTLIPPSFEELRLVYPAMAPIGGSGELPDNRDELH